MSSEPSSDRSSAGGDTLPPKKRKHTGRWLVVLLLVVLAGGGYLYREELCNTRAGGFLLSFFASSSSPKAVYYCPMHPSYRSDRPGTCPICNMNLEKLEPGASIEGETATSAQEPAPSGRKEDPLLPGPHEPGQQVRQTGQGP